MSSGSDITPARHRRQSHNISASSSGSRITTRSSTSYDSSSNPSFDGASMSLLNSAPDATFCDFDQEPLRRTGGILLRPTFYYHTKFTSHLIKALSTACILLLGFWVFTSIDRRSEPEDANHFRQVESGPLKWLQEHSNMRYMEADTVRYSDKPKAAIISLVRNEELDGILQSMNQLEHRWNKRYHYPWIFFSETPFSEEFKAATSNATSGRTSYELVPKAHWSTPAWIDMIRYMNSLDYLGMIGVGKGSMLSYRNMCRWNSGFFYKHPALSGYDYYWRVEPDVHFFCDIPYDPFRFLADNELVYGFNMNILDDARSFASLWRTTKEFMHAHPQLVHKDADLDWLIDNKPTFHEYNNCQFFSNFEIGDLNFFRGEANEAYFDFLDKAGGFYYERYGDAPVHTLSLAMFVPKNKVWFFRDIGYQHDIARHCPRDGVVTGRCDCEPTELDENFYKLVPMESPQKKPDDSCIRMWLGGKWLRKKDGWDAEMERAIGGDGYGGYVEDEV